MCYLGLLDAGAKLSPAVVDSIIQINGSGVGIVYADGSIKRWLYSDDARAALLEVRGPAMVHARFATVGGHHWQNVHPFASEWGTFAHNGTLALDTLHDLSDSATLASALHCAHAAGARLVLDAMAGVSNKFVSWSNGEFELHGEFDLVDGVHVANFYSWGDYDGWGLTPTVYRLSSPARAWAPRVVKPIAGGVISRANDLSDHGAWADDFCWDCGEVRKRCKCFGGAQQKAI